MAFTGNFMCTSFKSELFNGYHNFSNANPARSANQADTFKIALYDSGASLTAATTVYANTNELPTAGGYTQTGVTLSGGAVANNNPTGAVGYVDFTTDPSWTSATFTAYGALVYNSSQAGKAVVVLDFGGAKTVSSGTFTVVFPAAAASTALIRIA